MSKSKVSKPVSACSDWSFNNDCQLQRQSTAEFLTTYLLAESKHRQSSQVPGTPKSFVLNINAEWGAGKTTFLKCWGNMLHQKQHPVIYIDAWKNDFCEDPLLLLLSELRSQLAAQTHSATKRKANAIGKAAGTLLKSAAPAVLNSLATFIAGKAGQQLAEDVQVLLKSASGNLVDAGTQALFTQHKTRVDAIEKFKEELNSLTESIADTTSSHLPIFVLIDELDRCRPTFALEMLESIKHLFDVPNWIFIIASHNEQLQHTISGAYGPGFDGMTYLERFFDTRYVLSAPQNLEIFVENYFAKANLTVESSEHVSAQFTFSVLSKMLNLFNCSLRKKTQLLDRVIACLRVNGNFSPVALLAILLCEEFTSRGAPQNMAAANHYFKPLEKLKDGVALRFDDTIDVGVKASQLLKAILIELKRDGYSYVIDQTKIDMNLINMIQQAFVRASYTEHLNAVRLATNFQRDESTLSSLPSLQSSVVIKQAL